MSCGHPGRQGQQSEHRGFHTAAAGKPQTPIVTKTRSERNALTGSQQRMFTLPLRRGAIWSIYLFAIPKQYFKNSSFDCRKLQVNGFDEQSCTAKRIVGMTRLPHCGIYLIDLYLIQTINLRHPTCDDSEAACNSGSKKRNILCLNKIGPTSRCEVSRSRAVDCLFIETNSCSPEELHVRHVCYQTDFRKHKMLILI
ncbi:hypothetical protein Naga_100194g6 [Nannochloropsis gaditana]|uniref:Uncharacterized protein n=1 Tax=Nannochloropsis gaditana TaxID=72520 RepID=W7TM07_9STRA|nr:hypothetical protein Naga_100194g6 [Nannochloropsis gaditana]